MTPHAFRYAAFISYRHTEPDRKWARWLHRSLETYRVPRALVRQGGAPRSVGRVFRDEEELEARADLSLAIEEALRDSKVLIILCSPRTPASRWVNAEIERFRELGRADRIFALLIEGEPRDAFPPALCEIRRDVVDPERGRVEHVEEVEPLAADCRPRSGESTRQRARLAKLRLIAGVIGCRFDDLRQRENERRRQRLIITVALSALAFLLMAMLAFYALVQQDRAENALQETRTTIGRIYLEKANQALTQRDPLRAEALAAEGLSNHDTHALRLALARARAFGYRLAWTSPHAYDVGRETVAWSPDGQLLATDGPTEHILLWDATTGEQVDFLSGHQEISDLAFSPGGETLASASTDGTIFLWNVAARTQARKLYGHTDAVWSIAWSPDGKNLASVSIDGSLRIWDLENQKDTSAEPPSRKGLLRNLRDVTWSPDGSSIALAGSGGAWTISATLEGGFHDLDAAYTAKNGAAAVAWGLDGTLAVGSGEVLTDGKRVGRIVLLDVVGGRPRTRVLEEPDLVQALAWSPDGERLASVLGEAVQIWDRRSNNLLATARDGSSHTTSAWSPDGQLLATTSYRGLHLWNRTLGQVTVAARGHNAPASALAWSSDGKRLASGDWSGTVLTWEPASGAIADRIEVPNAVFELSWNSEAKSVAIAHRGWSETSQTSIGVVSIRDPSGSTTREVRRSESEIHAAVWLAADVMLTLDRNGQLERNGLDGTTKVLARLGDNVGRRTDWTDMALSPDRGRVVCAGEGVVTVVDTESGELLKTLPLGDDIVTSVAWSPDGYFIAAGTRDGGIRLWKGDGYVAHRELTGELGSGFGKTRSLANIVESLAWSPDGRLLASGSSDGVVRLWSPRFGLQAQLPAPEKVEVIAWRPDGRRLAAGSRDGHVTVWALDARTAWHGDHLKIPQNVVWSPDGRHLSYSVWQTEGRVTHVRDATEDRILLEVETGRDPGTVAWRPDGRALAIAGVGKVQFWELNGGVFLEGGTPRETGWVSALAWSPDGDRIGLVRPDRDDGAPRGGWVVEEIAPHVEDPLAEWRFEIKDSLGRTATDLKQRLTWDRDGVLVAASRGGIAGALAVYDRTGQRWTSGLFDQGVLGIEFTQDGTRLVAWPKAYPLEIREPRTGEVLQRFESWGQPTWSTKGRHLAIEDTGELRIVDPSSGNILQILEPLSDGLFSHVSFHPEGNMLAICAGNAIELRPTALDVHMTPVDALQTEAMRRTGLTVRNVNTVSLPQNRLEPVSATASIKLWTWR